MRLMSVSPISVFRSNRLMARCGNTASPSDISKPAGTGNRTISFSLHIVGSSIRCLTWLSLRRPYNKSPVAASLQRFSPFTELIVVWLASKSCTQVLFREMESTAQFELLCRASPPSGK
jgi:hypothetical protein